MKKLSLLAIILVLGSSSAFAYNSYEEEMLRLMRQRENNEERDRLERRASERMDRLKREQGFYY